MDEKDFLFILHQTNQNLEKSPPKRQKEFKAIDSHLKFELKLNAFQPAVTGQDFSSSSICVIVFK